MAPGGRGGAEALLRQLPLALALTLTDVPRASSRGAGSRAPPGGRGRVGVGVGARVGNGVGVRVGVRGRVRVIRGRGSIRSTVTWVGLGLGLGLGFELGFELGLRQGLGLGLGLGLGFHPLDGDWCEDEVDVAGGVKAETLRRLGLHTEGDLVVGAPKCTYWAAPASRRAPYYW
eukprot:scaffold82306_cov41-Phaeocystis_antarctica.AAC.1